MATTRTPQRSTSTTIDRPHQRRHNYHDVFMTYPDIAKHHRMFLTIFDTRTVRSQLYRPQMPSRAP